MAISGNQGDMGCLMKRAISGNQWQSGRHGVPDEEGNQHAIRGGDRGVIRGH